MQGGVKRVEASELSVHRLEILAGLSSDLLRFGQPAPLLESVFERFSRHSSVDLCLSYLVRDGRLQLAFANGLAPAFSRQIEWLEFGQSVCGAVARDRTPSYHRDILESDDPKTEFLRLTGICSFCCFPLMSGGNILGTLSFGSRRQPAFASEEIDLQQAVADQVAVAFDRIFLIEELARNNQKLTVANAQLRRANADLEQIAFTASHDFREPVRHVGIYAELLERKLQSSADDETKLYLGYINSSAKRLERLIVDFLDLSRVAKADDIRPEVDAAAVLSQVVSKLRPLIVETGADIIIHPLPPLRISEQHLEELFIRLLENALIFRRAGVPPRVEIHSPAERGQQIVCVRDNGIGIDAAHQDAVFRLFKRLHPENHGTSSGIGLTLCRKIVEQYGGQIWVESEPGQGALFCFTLGKHEHVGSFTAAAPDLLSGR